MEATVSEKYGRSLMFKRPIWLRAVEVGHQIAVEVDECDVVEGFSKGCVLFQEGLQRRGARESLRLPRFRRRSSAGFGGS